MRVLNVLFEERFGGPQSRVLQVSRELRVRDIETLVLVPRGDPFFATQLLGAGIEYCELPLVRLHKSISPAVHVRYLAKFWSNIKDLRSVIRREGIDLVHTNGVHHFQAGVAARMEGVPLVWHVNDVNAGPLTVRVFAQWVRRLAHVIAVASEGVAQHYFGQDWRSDPRIRVIYPPVETQRFDGCQDGESLRRELGISPDAPILGAVGTIGPGKGLEFLLRGAPGILAAFPETHFVIAGAPLDNRPAYWTMLQTLRERFGLQDRVHFLGRRTDTPRIFSALTIYVHPSEAEAASMAVMEAASSAKPVVATKVGGLPEVVRNGETGILVPPRSPDSIVEAVVALLRAPGEARTMGEKGARLMREHFSLRACVESHARAYQLATGLVEASLEHRPDSSALV